MLIVSRWLGYGLLVFSLGAMLGCSSEAAKQETEPVSRCGLPLDTSPRLGPDDAPVTILEFVDFQCPFCAAAEPIRDEVDAARPGLVRWVFKNLPLAGHARAMPAALAAACAHEQGKFWPMHDLLFADQHAAEDADFLAYARQIGLDVAVWQACLASDRPRARVTADLTLAEQAQIGMTPSYLINGIRYPGLQQRQNLLAAIDRANAQVEESGLASAQYYESLVAQGCQ
ncbi:MAG TPA: thioredoxin domain-containing protein [Polyangiaceae bacterium]|nr:thioredoxin domain-containing protein [Polyangiaceae bacterium]